ncbi:MAG: winged helix-turn-helix domain-containing protein [Labilithrix sp.]|nr:winged helix-turn-helix domain-containing protein [Labilithrix sp.]
MIHAFDRFELDENLMELRREGAVVRLQPRPFRLLVHLVHQRHRFVPLREILRDLWRDTAVTTHSATRAIYLLRRALEDDPRAPRFLANRPGYGYRFVAAVESIAPKACPIPSANAPFARAFGPPDHSIVSGNESHDVPPRLSWSTAHTVPLLGVAGGLKSIGVFGVRPSVPSKRILRFVWNLPTDVNQST